MSKKFLISTALVFALLAGKSFATENKPLESEDVTSTTLVVPVASEGVVSIGMDDLPSETITHTLSFVEAADLRVFALTSKGNYVLAEKSIPYLDISLNLDSNCFEPSSSPFLNITFKSDQIRNEFINRIKIDHYKTRNRYISIHSSQFLEDMIKFAKAQNYFFNPSIEAIAMNCHKSSVYGCEASFSQEDKNILNRDYPILGILLAQLEDCTIMTSFGKQSYMKSINREIEHAENLKKPLYNYFINKIDYKSLGIRD